MTRDALPRPRRPTHDARSSKPSSLANAGASSLAGFIVSAVTQWPCRLCLLAAAAWLGASRQRHGDRAT